MIAAVLGAFAVGLLLGRGIDRGDGELRDSAGNSLVAPTVRNSEQTPTWSFQNPRESDAPRAVDPVIEGFSYLRLKLTTDGDVPEACIEFSAALDTTGNINYTDYIRLTPSVTPATSINGSSLCLSGLEFNKEYTVRLRQGLPSMDGEKLAVPTEVTVAFGDKPAYVGFAGDGVILPREEADGIGIETVNVDRIQLDIFRVSDRALARKQIVAGEAIAEDNYYYVYGDENGEDVGVNVYSDEIDVAEVSNETVDTIFPFGSVLPNLKAGAYFVRLRDASNGVDKNRRAQTWRWILYTDLGLSTYSSSEGIDVFVRSLEAGKPIANVTLELIASNNDSLGRAVTNSDGRARFEKSAISGKHPLSPKMIMAYGPQQDFAAIDLTRTPLDLSDRNIGGRAASSLIDGYIYLDRGIYRPGETAHLTALMRDDAGRAIDRPLTLRIFRPNGSQAFENRFEETALGSVSVDYVLPDSAPRGQWRIVMEADGIGNVGTEQFSVEDFIPQRLKVNLEIDDVTPMQSGDQRSIFVESNYLYGAPASDLGVESEVRLRVDPNPFPDLKGYRYGVIDGRFDERFITLDGAKTAADGTATIPLKLEKISNKAGSPLRADLVVGVVEPGGRVVRESARIPVRPDNTYVGLRLAENKSSFGQNEPANIEAILIDRLGILNAGEIEWRLVEEDYWFDWYRDNGKWRWRRSYKNILIAEGREQATTDGPVSIERQLEPGSYRLAVTDVKSRAKTDIRFYVGWRSNQAGADTPDQATLTVTSENVIPGARARLFLDPPYAGEVIIAVATDKVHMVKRLKVGEDGREINIETDPAWGAGFYVLANVVTPRDAVSQPVPRRALGVAHIAFDIDDRKLAVELDVPEIVRPRQKLSIPVLIDGIGRGEDVMLTLAAVDEGILRLTKFQSPDPVDYYYGKKRLAVELRDDYGRILNANLGAATRVGGDQLGGEGLTVVPTKSVALFNGPIALDDDGAGVIEVDIPDFNGELRLMAVAWSRTKLGSLERALTVRDPVPAQLALPRFLAPGDESAVTLLVDNVEGEEGDYNVGVSGDGSVNIDSTEVIALAEGEKSTRVIPFSAARVGISRVALAVSGPENFSVTRDYPIQVRTPYFPVTEISRKQLQPGENLSLDRSLVSSFAPGSSAVSVSFSKLAGVDPGPLLDSLYRYPYGCTEQLTSSAMPLLFVDVLGNELGRDSARNIRPRVQKAINKLLDRQSPGGEFGLWREGDGGATAWIGAYVVDFLYRASQEGYAVPQAALQNAYIALEKIARTDRWTYVNYQRRAYESSQSNDTTDQLRYRSAAYAFYVLARAGRADISDLRYFHDALLPNVVSPLARAHIGAALEAMGDRARALSAFESARAALGFENTGNYYQSSLRDVAGVLALLSEAQNIPGLDDVVVTFDQLMREPTSLHTQEKAFVLLATQSLLRQAGEIVIAKNDETLDGRGAARRFNLSDDDLKNGSIFSNAGDGPVFASVTVYGAPQTAPVAAASGFELSKRVATRDGRAADLSSILQNERLVVVVTGRPTGKRRHPAIIADLLPAGFEIEAVLTPEDGARPRNSGPYAWIGEISRPKIAEARDDRFVAAIDLYQSRFTLAYVVRAVSPGTFTIPGAVIEDMYRPGVFARTDVGRLTISALE